MSRIALQRHFTICYKRWIHRCVDLSQVHGPATIFQNKRSRPFPTVVSSSNLNFHLDTHWSQFRLFLSFVQFWPGGRYCNWAHLSPRASGWHGRGSHNTCGSIPTSMLKIFATARRYLQQSFSISIICNGYPDPAFATVPLNIRNCQLFV